MNQPRVGFNLSTAEIQAINLRVFRSRVRMPVRDICRTPTMWKLSTRLHYRIFKRIAHLSTFRGESGPRVGFEQENFLHTLSEALGPL